MPNDVSDEALEKLCDDGADEILAELFPYRTGAKAELEQMLFTFAKRVRDMTVRRLDDRADELMRTTSFAKAWEQAVRELLAAAEGADDAG